MRRDRLVNCSIARKAWPFPLLVVAGVASSALPRASADLLYDVDFEAPTHIVDQMPTVGFGALPRKTPTGSDFGQPKIRSQAGILDGQFCRFESAYVDGYCQLMFGLDSQYGQISQQYPFYRVQMDMLVERMESLYDQFSVFVDNPMAQSLKFLYQDNMRVVILGNDAYQQTIGTFTEGSRFTIGLDCNQSTEWWRVYKDGVQIFEGAFPHDSGGTMRILRYSLASNHTSNTACVDIDNVRIEGLPEPATLCLFALGAIIAVRRPRPWSMNPA